MSYKEESEVYSEDPFFNMARKTLDCIDHIKKYMLFLDMNYPLDSPEKQKNYINLIQKFYMFSVPLFPVDGEEREELDRMEDEIMDLKVEKKVVTKNGSQSFSYIYSKDLDLKINKIFIKLNKLLKPYFMPLRRDDDGL